MGHACYSFLSVHGCDPFLSFACPILFVFWGSLEISVSQVVFKCSDKLKIACLSPKLLIDGFLGHWVLPGLQRLCPQTLSVPPQGVQASL